MTYQITGNNLCRKPNIQDFGTGSNQVQNVLELSRITTNNFITLILIIIVLVLLLSNVKRESNLFTLVLRLQKNCKKIPKAKLLLPVRLPVLDSIYTMVKFRKDGIQFLEQVTEKFGNLFEIPFGPYTITLVNDPVIIQKILSSSQLAYLNRPKIYHSIFGDIFHDGLITSENEIWSAQRKMLSRSFTYKSLQNYVQFTNTHAVNLTSRLNNKYQENDQLGIGSQRINQLLYCHVFKIISQIVMGTDSLSEEESNEVAEIFYCCKELVSDRALNPWKYLWLLPPRREYDRAHKYLNDFFVKMTQMYKKKYEQDALHGNKSTNYGADCDNDDESVGVKPFRCMIEEMLCSGASDKEIHQQVGTILGTGHETTVVAIRMLLLHLALNPAHQIACRAEVDNIINKKGYKHGAYGCNDKIHSFDLTMEDLTDLKYLERCILESGRITSIVPIFLRRIDAPLKIDDELEFPMGTNFAISNWTLHRDPNIYQDPLKFDPDRFVSENVKKRHPYSYTAFSLGPRICIGWRVAIMQIKVVMAYIIRHFEILSDDELENVKMHFGLTIVPERDFRITLKRRQ